MSKLLTSRTFYSIVLMFVVGGLTSLVPVFPPAVGTALQAVLAFMASYFKLNPSQTY